MAHRKDVLDDPVCVLFRIWQKPRLLRAPCVLLRCAALPMGLIMRPASSGLLLHGQDDTGELPFNSCSV